jgi:hypothetical protein
VHLCRCGVRNGGEDMRTAYRVTVALLIGASAMAVPKDAAAQGCTINWVGASPGSWQSRFNWSPQRVPQGSDNVCIGSADVTLSDFFNSHTINSLTSDGSLTVSGSGVFMRIIAGASIRGNLTIQSGTLEVNGPATIDGHVTINNGFLNGRGPTNVNDGMTLTNLVDLNGQTINHRGVATMTSSITRIRMWGGAVFNNLAGATFNAADGLGFDVGDPSSAFNNDGAFVKAATAMSATGFGGVQFNNRGTLDIQRGSLTFFSGFTQLGGTTILNGTTITMTSQPLTIRGGTLTGSGTISGSVLLAGTGVVSPGGPGQAGTFSIAGTYTQTEQGTLNAEIGGTSPALIDYLTIGGAATLGGILNVGQINGFSPAPGNQFAIMSFPSRAGAFATVNASGLSPQLNDTNVTLIALGTCQYHVTLSQQTFPPEGGAAAATIATGAGCAWTTTDFDSWIDIVPGSGTGSTTIAIGVGPNTGAQRVALVTVAGVSFAINQAAAPCEYTLSNSGQTIPAEGDAGAFNVATRADCRWTAVASQPWIRITSATTGLGEGQVQFSVGENTLPEAVLRVGSIDVSGVSFTIQQDAPTLTCTPGSYPVTLAPYAPAQLLIESKPYRVSYDRLQLTFAVTDHVTHCEANSNVGTLPVLVTNRVTGTEFHAADSIASATIRIFPPNSVTAPAPCDFSRVPFMGYNNECLLTSGGAGSYYANWTTTGFTTRVVFQDPVGSVPCPGCGTGPRSYWVSLDALGLSPATDIGAILSVADNYIHRTLIDHLSALHGLAIVQDPGNVNLLVVDREGRTTGRLRDGRTTNDVPGSRYFPSELYPAVLLLGHSSVAPFQVQLFGRQTGEFDLGITSSHAPDGLPAGVFSGIIAMGQTLGFGLNLDPISGDQTATPVAVVEGDLTGDGLVTCADVAVVRAAFGRRAGQPGFNAWADKVFPGVIDVRDLAFVTQKLPAGTVCQ